MGRGATMTDSSCLARARRSERRVRAGRHPGGRHSPCHPQAVGDIGGPSGARGMRHAQRPCDRTRREGAWGTTVRQGESRRVRRRTVPGRPPFVPAPSSQTPALGLQTDPTPRLPTRSVSAPWGCSRSVGQRGRYRPRASSPATLRSTHVFLACERPVRIGRSGSQQRPREPGQPNW